MKRLSTIENALRRKEVALRALSARVARRHSQHAIPTTDAARLAILRAEVESLTRSRDQEAIALATPESRALRLERTASPPRRGATQSATKATPPAQTPVPPPTSGDSDTQLMSPRSEKGESDQAWRAYREAQRRRDMELREGMRNAWRANGSNLKQLRERGSPRVESKTLGDRVSAGRRDGKVLNAELVSQRAQEWARHSERLRQIKAQSTKRVDDRIGYEILTSKPLYSLSSSISSPSLWPSAAQRRGEGASAQGTPRDAYAWPEGNRADSILEAKYSEPGMSPEEMARSVRESDPIRYAYTARVGQSPHSHAGSAGRPQSARAGAQGEAATYEEMRKMLKPWK